MKKQIISILVTLLIIIVTLEIIPFIVGSVFIHDGYSRSRIKETLFNEGQQKLDSTIQLASDNGAYLGEHLLHPYLGYVSVPRKGYNEYGFYGPDPLQEKPDNVIKICLTGGSVAKQLYQVAGDRIRRNLETSQAFSGKKIEVYSLALGGFKQPQQLLSLNYLQALGADFDIIINLDGFNEIVLPLSDNVPFKVFPTYPRHWNIYSRKKLDQRVILQMGKQASLQEDREQSKNKLARSVFRQSNFVLFLWKISDQEKHNKILQAEAALRNSLDNKEADYQSTGPEYTVGDTISFLQKQADFWANSSRQLSALANESHIKYYHFLQPNQYDEGSKTLTDEELNIAFESGPFAYKSAAKNGYPLLRAAGKNLKESGVNYTDLSTLFINESRSVYADKCCHFNELGYFTIADQISSKIVNDN